MRDEDIFLSVVIPAYNEEQRILPTLEKINSYFRSKDYTFEMIVVDDGSTDKTSSLINNLSFEVTLLRNEKNIGKGYSVKRGVSSAHGKYILFTDADLSTPIEETEKLICSLEEGADVAIGSRALPTSLIRIRQPWWREGMGKVFNLFVQGLVFKGVKDTQCGFKCFRREVARRLFYQQKIKGFSFDVEILFLAKNLGYKIKEIPVIWVNSKDSKVHPIIDATKMLFELFRIRLNYLRNWYEIK